MKSNIATALTLAAVAAAAPAINRDHRPRRLVSYFPDREQAKRKKKNRIRNRIARQSRRVNRAR